ncbi:spore coat associated protein CotJA [Lachnospiraceae bacterium 62-35]
MDYYMNSRRSDLNRSQPLRTSAPMAVGMQCCRQPDMSPGFQPCIDTSMYSSSPSSMQCHGGVSSPMQADMPAPSLSVSPASTQMRPCPGPFNGPVESYPVGIGYVPMQHWNQTYNLEMGFFRGTIFPELDLPFVMGRCQ